MLDLHCLFVLIFFALGINAKLRLGRHVETGFYLSAKHVIPIGDVTLVARC
jgi:hypothetical protein